MLCKELVSFVAKKRINWKQLEGKGGKQKVNMTKNYWLSARQKELKSIKLSQSIKHRCLGHGEVHNASPAQLLNGSGLKCCRLASVAATGKRLREKAARDLVNDLKTKNPNVVWESGEYKDDQTKLNFFCLVHEETHLASPSNIK